MLLLFKLLDQNKLPQENGNYKNTITNGFGGINKQDNISEAAAD